ncbi:MAG: DNA polymerase III subunit gamma/tau [Patescibacteria group bacterium]|jgi:DNA polymerase-3 subunit gamma/tau
MVHEAIYRKYRPQVFADIVGQSHIRTTLENQLKTNRVAHAYLFSGPRGIGKTTCARLLAKAVNCEQRKEGSSEPCNACEACQNFLAGRSLDIVEIDAATHTGVENVRDTIIDAVRFAPAAGKFKVFIIDEVHMLSTSSFNALLKTLEEPPAYAIFILATTEMQKIPETILSRCQRFDFRRMSPQEMLDRLHTILTAEDVEIEEEVLRAIIRASEGALRDAESLLGQVLALGEKKITKELASLVIPVGSIETTSHIIAALVMGDEKAAMETLISFQNQGGMPTLLLDEMIEYVRMILFERIGAPHDDRYPDVIMQEIRALAKTFNEEQCLSLLNLLLDAKARPATDPFPSLPLELAMVLFCTQKPRSIPVPVVVTAPPCVEGADLLKTIPIQKGMPEKKAEPVVTPEKKASFTLEEVQNKWGRCCEAVGARNIALPMALNEARPESFDVDGRLCIRFDREFHFETLNKPGNLKILTEAIAEVMQSPVVVMPIFTKKPEGEVNDLAQQFGGEVM